MSLPTAAGSLAVISGTAACALAPYYPAAMQLDARAGWRFHRILLGVGLALAVPVTIADLALLRPSGGSSMFDFRGLFIGGYAALLVVEAAVSTAIVAIGRGRSRGLVLLAHGGAVLAMLMAGALWLVLDERESLARLEASERAREAAWRAAPGELTVTAWRPLPDAETPTLEVTLRASVAGRLRAEYVRSPTAYAFGGAWVTLAEGDVTTLTLPLEEGGEPGDGHYVHVHWEPSEGHYPILMRFCAPACPRVPELEDFVLAPLP